MNLPRDNSGLGHAGGGFSRFELKNQVAHRKSARLTDRLGFSEWAFPSFRRHRAACASDNGRCVVIAKFPGHYTLEASVNRRCCPEIIRSNTPARAKSFDR